MKTRTTVFAWTPVLIALAAVLCGSVCAETPELDNITTPAVVIVDLEHPDQPLDTRAPSSLFVTPDGEKIWNAAKVRALTKPVGRSGGIFDFNIVPDNFNYSKNFYNERFNPGETTEDLSVALSAGEARRVGKKLVLTDMRMIYFIGDTPPGATKPGDPTVPGAKPAKPKKAKPGPPAPPTKPGDKKKKEPAAQDAGPMSIPSGGRVIITAPKCEIDLETNEGYASGGTSVEIFPKPEEGKESHSTAKLFSPFLRWRSWTEAAIGSTEIIMYTCSNDPNEADPEVSGTFLVPQPTGPDSDIKIRGRGMIFESGKYDRQTPVYDEENRTAGTSLVARSKAFFHTNISTEMTASAITSLMPFQGPAPDPNAGKTKQPNAGKQPGAPQDPNAPKDPAKKVAGKKKQTAEPEPYKTVVTCNGPAVFDMAYVPLKTTSPVVDPKSIGDAVDLDLKPMFMGKRFEFLNSVNLIKTPIKDKPPEPGALDMATHMSCGHLRIQYPPNSMPSMSSFPDYSEAIGGVNMFGYKEPPPPEPGMPPEPAEPFSIKCDRMYLDGPNDNMFLVGPDDATEANDKLAFVKYTSGAAFAQQFCYRRKTQTLTMPSEGRKKMIIHPGAVAGAAAPAPAAKTTDPKNPASPAAPASGSMLAGGDTFISWSGPLSRELRHVPLPGRKDLLKEVLTLHKDVVIEQPDSGLKIYGEMIRLHSDALTKDVEFLYAQNDVDIFMGDIEARGDLVTVDMSYEVSIERARAKAYFWHEMLTTPRNFVSDRSFEMDGLTEPQSIPELFHFAGNWKNNLITIIGNRKLGIKADVFRGGGNAVRADKFVIDKITDNFNAYGGAVAVVKSATPPPPASDAVKPPDAAQGAAGLMSGIKFDAGGDIFIQCDGPFRQNALTHRVTAEGNVLIRQTGLTLMAERIKITMDDGPPDDPNTPGSPKNPSDKLASTAPGSPVSLPSGASPRTPVAKPAAAGKDGAKVGSPPAPEAADFFSAGLKTLECFDKVELVTDDKLIHCDDMKFDAKKEFSLLTMDDKEDDVRVYIHGEDGSDKVLCARKSLLLDQKTGTFTPGGQLLMIPYKKAAPEARGRDNSPARLGAK